MKLFYHLLAFPVATLLAVQPMKAQLAVWSEPSDTNFIFALSGPGILVENPVRNCHPDASGFFDATFASLDLLSGALLSSGSMWDAPGPNALGSTSTAHFFPGDPDLDGLPGIMAPSYDACVLEFDMTVSSDTLKLDYIFGSEEYLEFAGSSFNDAFAFFLSGPGITGTVNIALVPGSSDPVSINTINSMTNPSLYVDNGDGYTAPYSTDSVYVEYDGLTVRLQARHPVMPDSTYHMKLVVADVADAIFDSGVFLATGALGSLRLSNAFAAAGTGGGVQEGCDAGRLTFSRDPVTADTLWLDLAYTGSANGDDFADLPARLAILPGESEADLWLETLTDLEPEGTEWLKIQLFNPQSGYVYQSIDVMVEDREEVDYVYTTPESLRAEFTASDYPSGSLLVWSFGDGASAEGTFAEHDYTLPGSYEVCLTAFSAGNCDWTECKLVEVSGSTGLSEGSADNLNLYPNPTSGLVFFTGALSREPFAVSVYDALGQLILQKQQTTPMLDLGSFAAGFYTLRAEQNGKVFTGNLLVE